MFETLNESLYLARKIETELLPYDLEYYLGIRKPDPDSEDEDEEVQANDNKKKAL